MKYSHRTNNDEVKVEISDSTRRIIYRLKFPANDKNQWLAIIKIAEKYGFSIASLFNKDWV